MSGIPWTDRELEVLTELASRGCTAREVNSVIQSRTVAAIGTKASVLNLSLAGAHVSINENAFAKFKKRAKIERSIKCL